MAMLFILAAGLIGASQSNDLLPAVMNAQESKRVVTDVETFSNGALFSYEITLDNVQEAEKDSVVEKVIKRVSQYHPHWLKGWGFPTLVVLTGVGMLLLLVWL
jgi:hypothetical protein